MPPSGQQSVIIPEVLSIPSNFHLVRVRFATYRDMVRAEKCQPSDISVTVIAPLSILTRV